jgi:hypothetical protein
MVEKVVIDQTSYDLIDPSGLCLDELKSQQRKSYAEYRRLQSLAQTFWHRAKAMKAEHELLQAEIEEREKAQTKVRQVSGKADTELIWQRAWARVEEFRRLKGMDIREEI